MGQIKLFYFYSFIFSASSMLVGVLWFLVSSFSVLLFFGFGKSVLVGLLYLGGFMILFVYMMSLGGYMLSSSVVVVLTFVLLVLSEGCCCFSGSFFVLTVIYYSYFLVFLVLGQLLFLLLFLSGELSFSKSMRVL